MTNEPKTIDPKNYLLNTIPKDAKSLYVHITNEFSNHNHLIDEIQEQYDKDNILITYSTSKYISYCIDNFMIAQDQKKSKERLIESFNDFSAKNNVDAIIYLCKRLCDGHDIEILLWHPVRLAEQLQKPLIVGYQDNICFAGETCSEVQYLLNESKLCNITLLDVKYFQPQYQSFLQPFPSLWHKLPKQNIYL